MIITHENFSKVFHQYCKEVRENKKKRIEYDSYRVLNDLCSIKVWLIACDLSGTQPICQDEETEVTINITDPNNPSRATNINIPYQLFSKFCDMSINFVNSNALASSYCCSNDVINKDFYTTSATTVSPTPYGNISTTTITPPISYPATTISCSPYSNGNSDLTFTTKELLEQIEKEKEKSKEKKSMNMPNLKFDFGPANPNSVAMSPYGLAIRCGDAWYAYNTKENQTIDVTGMTFTFKNAIYKMPVAVSQIKEGDLIVHQNKAMYVTQVKDKTSIEVIDLAASEQKTVIPVSNMFGFNYITKITPLFNLGNIAPSAENPFGNILPMMMMSSLFDDDKSNKSEGNDAMQMMLIISMMNGNNPFSELFAGASPKVE